VAGERAATPEAVTAAEETPEPDRPTAGAPRVGRLYFPRADLRLQLAGA